MSETPPPQQLAEDLISPAVTVGMPMTGADASSSGEERSLDTKILRGSSWVAVGLGGGQLLSLLSMLALVRLLDPKAFGLAALATTFIVVVEYLQESGLGAALVYRRRDVREAAACALVFSPLFAVFLCAACAVVAPYVAALFHERALTDIFRVISLVLIIRSLGVAPGAIIERSMDFRSRAAADLSAAVTQVTVAISLAVAGLGVWSLIFGYLAAALVRTVVIWVRVPWRPSPRRASWRLFREMVRYGRFVSASNIVNLFNRTLDNLTVGRLLGSTPLGFYAVAFRLASVPVDSVAQIVGRPMFAAYSTLQHDLAALRRAYVQNLQRVTLFTLPLSVSVAVAAQPIVLALLGDQWRAVITPLRILALYALVKSVTSACGAVWSGLGKPHINLVFQVFHIVMVLPALILLTQHFGLTGAAVAMLVVDVASGIPALIVTMRLVRLAPGELARSLAPSSLSAGLLALALVLLLPLSSSMSAPAALAVLVPVALVVYVAATAAFARSVVALMWVNLRGAPRLPG